MKPARIPVRIRLLSSLVLALAALSLFAGEKPPLILLDAHFDDKPVDQLIGTGGAEAGEPISVGSNLDAIVRQDADDPANRVLELGTVDSASTSAIRFEFIEHTEAVHSRLLVSVQITVPDPDFGQGSLYLREATGSAKRFLDLVLQTSGFINISDAAGTVANIPNGFQFGQPLLIEVFHDLDERTYDLLIDGVYVVEDRAHGITDRGIGAFIVSMMNRPKFEESRLMIDDLLVAHWSSDAIFAHGFEVPDRGWVVSQ